MFFEEFIGIRITKRVMCMLQKLLDEYPEKYDSYSHIIRCSIINLYNEKITNKNNTYKSNYHDGSSL